MNALGRFLFRTLERIFGVYNEGPEPPRRYAEEVRMFRVIHPRASQELWERFAVDVANRTYREGWIRGFEYHEREWPGADPVQAALDQRSQQDWSLARQSAYWEEAMRQVGMEPMDAQELERRRRDAHYRALVTGRGKR